MDGWIESHRSLLNHPKLGRLCRRLSISKPQAIGHLHALWWWALEYATDGDITTFEEEAIAEAAMWDGDSFAFWEALKGAGFIDLISEGPKMVLHDWQDYAGPAIEARQQAADRQRQRRSRLRHADVTLMSRPVTGGSTEITTTVPNQTIPNHSSSFAREEGQKVLIPEPPDPAFQKAETEWLNTVGRTLREKDSQLLQEAIDDYGIEWVLEAIRETGKANNPNLGYTASILRRMAGDARKHPPRGNGARGSPDPRGPLDAKGRPLDRSKWTGLELLEASYAGDLG